MIEFIHCIVCSGSQKWLQNNVYTNPKEQYQATKCLHLEFSGQWTCGYAVRLIYRIHHERTQHTAIVYCR